MASLAELIVARSTKAAEMVRQAQAKQAEERASAAALRKQIEAEAQEIRDLAYQTFITVPLQQAKIDPDKASRRDQDTKAHGRLYDRAVRQVIEIAKDTEAKAHVINCLKHAWEDKAGFVAAASCFVTAEEAKSLGYRW